MSIWVASTLLEIIRKIQPLSHWYQMENARLTLFFSKWSYIIDEAFIVKFMTHFKLNKTLLLQLERLKTKHMPQEDKSITYRLVVELTLVLLRERREIIESPQLTTVPLLIENVRNRYRSSLWRGLYGRSGNEQTRGRWWSGTTLESETEKLFNIEKIRLFLCILLITISNQIHFIYV